MIRSVWALTVPAALAVACSDPETYDAGELRISYEPEPAPWTLEPAATSYTTYAESAGGERVVLDTSDSPPEVVYVNQPTSAHYGFEGTDADGDVVVAARSLLLSSEGLVLQRLPLLALRTDRFSRLPGELGADHGASPLTTTVSGRHLLVLSPTEEGPMVLEAYDALNWWVGANRLEVSCPEAPCAPVAMAPSGSLVVILGRDWAIWVDVVSRDSNDFPRPSGLDSFSELADAPVVYDDSGYAYVVGPASPTVLSDAILVLGPDGSYGLVRSRTSRRGAAAAWVAGRGLVLAGGSAVGPGVELLPDGGDTFEELEYSPDATRGAAIAVGDSSKVVRLGGETEAGEAAASAFIDLTCDSNCELELSDIKVELPHAQIAGRSYSGWLVSGSDSREASRTYLLDEALETVTELELAVPRSSARPARLPTGYLAIVGGTDEDGAVGTIESIPLR